MQKSFIASLLAAGALLVPSIGSAATITGWITSQPASADTPATTGNVVEGPEAANGETGASVVYDQNFEGGVVPAGANTYGQVVYAAPEANTPGVEVLTGQYTGAKTQVFSGCIKTSSAGVPCEGEFQSGKRVKQQVTDIGPIDLVFGVEATPDEPDDNVTNDVSLYQVFHRLINVTGQDLTGFTLQLGTGVGDDFDVSTDGDGLRFADTNLFTSGNGKFAPGDPLAFGPDDLTSFSQFPYGLYGGVPLNPNPLELKGFFDTGEDGSTGRAGFDVVQTEDEIKSTSPYGSYTPLFGDWLSQGDVPEALFWAYEEGVDPLLMAWANDDGMWEIRRDIADGVIDEDGMWGDLGPGSVLSLLEGDWETFGLGDIAGVAGFLGLAEGDLLQGPIEDLANLNLTFGIELANSFIDFGNTSFTLRAIPTAAVSAVPLPAGAPLLIAGLAALGYAGRRRKAAA